MLSGTEESLKSRQNDIQKLRESLEDMAPESQAIVLKRISAKESGAKGLEEVLGELDGQISSVSELLLDARSKARDIEGRIEKVCVWFALG